MTALLLSIVCATYLVLVFKVFKRFSIDNLQAIVVNYITCIATGILISRQTPSLHIIHEDWFPYAIFLGLSFITIFNLMGYVASTTGVTLTSVAGKLSMVIPVTAAIFLYDERVTVVKIAGLVLAVAALYFSSITREKNKKEFAAKGMLLAFLIFIGSGINDSIVNYASKKFLDAEEFDLFNVTIFTCAATAGLLVMFYRFIFAGKIIQMKAVAGGILLGVPNYFSLYFLLQAISIPGWESSVVFPINNMGVVILTAIAGWLLFKEHLSKINLIGLAAGLIAIGLMIVS